MTDIDAVPKYTIRVKPPVKESGDDAYTFGCPVVMLVDADGNESARLMGIGGVTVEMEHEGWAELQVRFAQFECERLETRFRKSLEAKS